MRSLSPGDLVLLSSEEWADGWRDQIAIVLCDHDIRRLKSYKTGKTVSLRRWRALAGGEQVIIIQDDVTLIQGVEGERS